MHLCGVFNYCKCDFTQCVGFVVSWFGLFFHSGTGLGGYFKERFSSETGIDEIVSEVTGLIAPLWNYVGVAVFARNCSTE